MRTCFTNNLNLILILEIVIAFHEIFAQEGATVQDLVALCSEKGLSNCGWLESSKNQNALSELMVRLNDVGDTSFAKYRNRFYPRFAPSYDENNGVFRYPHSRIWKGGPDQLVWYETNKMDGLQPTSPYNYDAKRGNMHAFSSWGGKRGRVVPEDTLNFKRGPAFSSWGGKRTQKFFNWGGKRSVKEGNEFPDPSSSNSEHNVMKRNADVSRQDDTMCRRKCITNEMNLEELFKEFIEWSRKQPEQKKGSIYRKVFGISALRSPDNLSRRAGSFFQWGGKRSAKEN